MAGEAGEGRRRVQVGTAGVAALPWMVRCVLLLVNVANAGQVWQDPCTSSQSLNARPSIGSYHLVHCLMPTIMLPAHPGPPTPDEQRPLPARLCRMALVSCAKQHRWAAGWAFDGRKNLYSPQPFLPTDDTSFIVTIVDDEDGQERQMKVGRCQGGTLAGLWLCVSLYWWGKC